MSKPLNALIAAVTMTAVTLSPIAQVHADDHRGRGWERSHDGGWHGGTHHGRKHGKKRRGRGAGIDDDALLLGVLGLAAGAIIAGAILSEPPVNSPPPRYRRSAPGSGWADLDYYPPAPGAGYRSAGAIEPWTDAWYRYCTQRYRSFNPNTGTFRGYDGIDHFCVARN